MTCALTQGLRTASAAFVAAGALCVPAHASTFSDAYPTPQAIAAHAEFLAQAPEPPTAGTICVIDTGVDPLPDLGDRVIARLAIDGGDPGDVRHDPADPSSGHGSFVAGTIASQVDGQGSAGIWPRAKIVSIRVEMEGRFGVAATDYLAAIAACRDPQYNVAVINISLAGPVASEFELSRLHNQIVSARNEGIHVVASAGNELGPVGYPARFPESFAVSAVDGNGRLCEFSSTGPELDLLAPGCNSRITSFDSSSGTYAGTSFAAPVVSATLSALRSLRPSLTVDEAEWLLTSNARVTETGRVMDAAATFRAAGLASIVDAYRPPVTEPTDQPPSDAPEPALPHRSAVVGPAMEHSYEQVARPPKPSIKSIRFKRRILRVQLRTAIPKGISITFVVDGKTYSRRTGQLTVRIRTWRRVKVFLEDRWGERSAQAIINRAR